DDATQDRAAVVEQLRRLVGADDWRDRDVARPGPERGADEPGGFVDAAQERAARLQLEDNAGARERVVLDRWHRKSALPFLGHRGASLIKGFTKRQRSSRQAGQHFDTPPRAPVPSTLVWRSCASARRRDTKRACDARAQSLGRRRFLKWSTLVAAV